jgi:hypothetical protein
MLDICPYRLALGDLGGRLLAAQLLGAVDGYSADYTRDRTGRYAIQVEVLS